MNFSRLFFPFLISRPPTFIKTAAHLQLHRYLISINPFRIIYISVSAKILTFTMAHQPTQGHKQKHKAQAHEKSSKASKAAKSPKHQSKGAIKHLEKQSGAIKKPPKIKKTVSAAGMFKKHRKHKQPTPEPDLMQDLRCTISIFLMYLHKATI